MLLWEQCRHHSADLYPEEPPTPATSCRQQLLPATSPAIHRWHLPRASIMGNLSSCLGGVSAT
jgi:hypothetical protein